MAEINSPNPSRRRGRPRTSEGPAVSRSNLLQIAARAIGGHGFDRTSIRSIAKEAGVSMRTVQHHFPSKDDLWRALVDDVIVPRVATPLSDDATKLPDTVEAEVGLRIQEAIENPGLSAAVLTDPSDGGRDRLEYLSAATAETQRENLLTLAAHMDAGALRSMDPRSLAVAISIGLACISSAKTAIDVLYDVDLEDADQRNALTKDITDLLLYGLLPRKDGTEQKKTPS
ncbi:MAG: TetR/AcrR family transcriptional regulator [Deltaproteobacteria bacterium]|nr:TetR/AcrR family transcriptional regulator [Deltaproteobacteria bacterium]